MIEMINTYHFWKMVAIITPIFAALIIGFSGYKMYKIKSVDFPKKKRIEFFDDNSLTFVQKFDCNNCSF